VSLLEAPIDFSHVEKVFTEASAGYKSAQPFPHAAFQGLFDNDYLRQMEAEFPGPREMAGSFSGEIEGGKYTESDFAKLGPRTQAFVAAANSGTFCSMLTTLTGIPGLISDPYLAGGGLHQTARGGRLKVHSDFNVHPSLNLTRRLNMIVYLNDDWDPEWGGALELWDQQMTEAKVRIAPSLGNAAIFTCSDISFHGLPDPLLCPENRYRRSVAFYYFTADAETPEPRSTLWRERPGETFMSRPSARIRRAGGLALQSIKALGGK
jgi:hypothetical protein